MKTNQLKIAAALAAAIVVLALTFRSGVHAQDKSTDPQVTTNWMGCLVIGKQDTNDRFVIGGPYPQAKSEIDIGLRSDGVVVWRKAQL